MPMILIEPGTKNGRLTFVREVDRILGSQGPERMGLFACDCGAEIAARITAWRRGNTKSCGCLVADILRERSTTHGQCNTMMWKRWASMRRRCTPTFQAKNSNYAGVTCDPRWETFEGFCAHPPAGTLTEQMVLGRYGDAGPYSPENARWITRAENASEMQDRLRDAKSQRP